MLSGYSECDRVRCSCFSTSIDSFVSNIVNTLSISSARESYRNSLVERSFGKTIDIEILLHRLGDIAIAYNSSIPKKC